jgi:hypothetical protein
MSGGGSSCGRFNSHNNDGGSWATASATTTASSADRGCSLSFLARVVRAEMCGINKDVCRCCHGRDSISAGHNTLHPAGSRVAVPTYQRGTSTPATQRATVAGAGGERDAATARLATTGERERAHGRRTYSIVSPMSPGCLYLDEEETDVCIVLFAAVALGCRARGGRESGWIRCGGQVLVEGDWYGWRARLAGLLLIYTYTRPRRAVSPSGHLLHDALPDGEELVPVASSPVRHRRPPPDAMAARRAVLSWPAV